MSPDLQPKQSGIRRRRKSRDQLPPPAYHYRQEHREWEQPSLSSCLYRLPTNSSSCCAFSLNPPLAFHPDPLSYPPWPVNCAWHADNKFSRLQPPADIGQGEGCASLPAIAKDGKPHDEDVSQRRYSDPGVPNDSDESSDCDNPLFGMLTHQVHALQESNRQLVRDVAEMRMEVSLLRQQQKHASSMDREYEPGMITNFIKEIRDAARIREDALLTKVKHMVEEKQFTSSQYHFSAERSSRDSERLSKLEERIKSLHCSNADDSSSNHSARQVCEMEREVLHLRREVQEYRARKEESDQKIHQLEKKISHLTSTTSEEKSSPLSSSTFALDNLSMAGSSHSSIIVTSPLLPKFTQVGPVTDL